MDLIVGAPQWEDSKKVNKGAVYWLRQTQGFGANKTVWVEKGHDVLLQVFGAAKGDELGKQVCGGRILSNDPQPVMLMAAPNTAGPDGAKCGKVYGQFRDLK